MAITTNLDNAIIEDGQYLVAVTKAEQRTSGAGNDMLALEFGIATGPHAGQGLPVWEYLVFSAGARARTAHALRSLGVPIGGDITIEAENLVGRRALVTIKTVHEEAKGGYDARDVQKIVAYDTPPKSAADTLVDDALALPGTKAVDDDDIPF